MILSISGFRSQNNGAAGDQPPNEADLWADDSGGKWQIMIFLEKMGFKFLHRGRQRQALNRSMTAGFFVMTIASWGCVSCLKGMKCLNLSWCEKMLLRAAGGVRKQLHAHQVYLPLLQQYCPVAIYNIIYPRVSVVLMLRQIGVCLSILFADNLVCRLFWWFKRGCDIMIASFVGNPWHSTCQTLPVVSQTLIMSPSGLWKIHNFSILQHNAHFEHYRSHPAILSSKSVFCLLNHQWVTWPTRWNVSL